METYIAALDQGTTTSRAILFNSRGEIVSKAQYPFRQIFPQPGWVEHDPMEIWATTVRALSEAVDAAHIDPKAIAGIGITNQRETAILWDRRTGQPVYNAIVWQCRRTAEICDRLKADGLGETVTEKTGLLIDAYFSGTKLKWIMDNIPGVRQRAERGELCAGTVDSWLIWNLTGGKAHVTDYSNASRTMLFNIHTLQWDPALCAALDIPMDLLPEPKSNSEVYGHLASGLPGLEDLAGIPVCGSAGDQQSALFGQACFTPGQAKNTYGTGCFTLMNVGDTPVRSRSGLVTSVGWQVAGKTVYALEGSVFNAGSTIQWLRDELGLIQSAPECDRLAESVGHTTTPRMGVLSAIETDCDWCGRLQGLALKNVTLTLKKGKKVLYSDLGEMLFTHFGISGPLTLTMSCHLPENLAEANVTLDLKPGLTAQQLDTRLQRELAEDSRRQLRNVLPHLLPASFAEIFPELCGVDGSKVCAQVTKEEREKLVSALKALPIPLKKLAPIEEAIVTRGGVNVREIDPATMESRKVSGLYFAGEVIDVDAHTGGYNLQIAWATGALAGQSAGEEEIEAI